MIRKFLAKTFVALTPTHFLRKAARRRLLSTGQAVVNDMNFDVDPSDFWQKFNDGEWERETFAFYREHVSPEKDVIDIGGWIGPTMLLAYAFNARKVTVVEADPANFQRLKRAVRANYLEDRIELLNLCLSHRSGDIVKFGAASKKKGSSTKRIGVGQTKVITTSATDFIKGLDLDRVNVIKIDIEGAEQDMLEALDLISDHPGISILFSVHVPLWRDARKTIAELLEKAEKFEVFDEKGRLQPPDYLRKRFENEGYFAFILKSR